MPYINNSGTWVDEGTGDRTPCRCSGCREFARTHGRSPEEYWADGLSEPEYAENGFDQRGFDREGYDREGYDRDGYGRGGYNRDGYGRGGYNREGFDADGYNYAGYNRDGYNRRGYDREGYNRDGFDHYGFNRSGSDRYGYDIEGFDEQGYNRYGFDRDGYDAAGYDTGGWNRNGFNRAGDERPCDCYDCLVDRGECPDIVTVNPESVEEVDRDAYDEAWDGGGWLHSYSHTPDPLIFRRAHGEDRKTVPYYGMEIELTSRLSAQEHDIAGAVGLDGDLLYFKEDGSVEGFEMVTHPMTFAWAQENFPWEVVELMGKAGATVRPDENGLHIHVSRAGFKDEAHLYRWLKLWYRNDHQIIRIAGRDGARWGGFSSEQRKLQSSHAKAQAKFRHNPRLRELHSTDSGDRYSAINLQNAKTVEVRLFAATTRARTLQTRFELVAGTVEYTRNLKTGKLLKGGWNWDAFMLWLDENGDTYPHLTEHQGSNILAAIGRHNQNREPALTLA